MKATSNLAILFFLFLIVAAAIHAEVIVNNLDQPKYGLGGPIGTDNNNNDFLIGQEFTLPAGNYASYKLDKVTLLLSPLGGYAYVTVSIWNVDTNNNPAGKIATVASDSVPVPENVDFVPTTNIFLPPGMYYVVAAPTTPADNAAVDWAYTGSWSNWTGSGILDGYALTIDGYWTNYSIAYYPFQLSVQATPIVGTLAIHKGDITTLSWPSSLNGFVLESTTNLTSTHWQTITNEPTQVANENSVSNNWNDSRKLFRLRQNFAVNNLDQPVWDWDGPIGTDNNANDFLMAQEFTLPAGNFVLNKVTLLLNPVYGQGNVTASIWTVDANGNPTNEISVIASQLVTQEENVDFTPSAPIPLSSGNYYIVVQPTSSTDNAKVGWDYTISTYWAGFGAMTNYADTYPGSWDNSSSIFDGPFQMSVQVTPTSP